MLSTYSKTMRQIAIFEGGYVNHPKDPGGATNFGITQAVYDAYRKSKKLSQQSVKSISSAEVEDIYKTRYADKIRYFDLPEGVDFAVMDAAVNSGVSRGSRWLQRAVGAVADGKVGNQTIEATQAADALKTIKKIYQTRSSFLHSLKIFSTFGKGWMRRLATGEAFAVDLQMKARSISTASKKIVLKTESTKADISAKSAATTAAGAGTGSAGTGTQVDFSNLADIQTILIVAAVVGLAVIGVYLFQKSRLHKERALAYENLAAGGV